MDQQAIETAEKIKTKCCASCTHWGATEPDWDAKGSREIWQWCDQKPKAWANRAYVCGFYRRHKRRS